MVTLTGIKQKGEEESPKVASAKPPKFMNEMEMQWNYATSEQLTTALLCSPALASRIAGWYHDSDRISLSLWQMAFVFLSLGSRMGGIPADFLDKDLGECWLGNQCIQCGRMAYLKQLPAIFLCTYVHLWTPVYLWTHTETTLLDYGKTCSNSPTTGPHVSAVLIKSAK